MKRIDWNLDGSGIDSDDDLCITYQGEVFTGEIVETGVDKLLSQQFYVNGIQEGPDREWWSNGSLKSEGVMKNGRACGSFRRWHENGLLAQEQRFNDCGALFSVSEWAENGNPIDK
ncbi:toxin-antitoxin system YwqK family antitoxin [Nocardia sp. IBHARD005]|uniref:toxin-antitoxin system YwqK family antitoxin n=1 Tax=Nocardia sp. IBHARD005 TaxID=3457765 RepID=UPI00405956B8